jgi:hypothetical protein
VRVKFGVAAVVATVVVAAGCGGGGGGGGGTTASVPASIAPGNAVAYVSTDTNFDSAAWMKVEALLDRFPDKDTILANFRSSLRQQGLDWETDVKPAFGDETDVVWLDFSDGGQNFVGITKPRNGQKLDALLAKHSTVHEQVEGWTVFARNQQVLDRFDQARSDQGSLESVSAFTDAVGKLPQGSTEAAWVRGDVLQSRLDQRLQASGAPADTTKKQLGELDSLSAALTPGSDGVRLDLSFNGDLDLGGDGYHAELPSSLPAGAMLYLSFNGIGNRLNKLVDTLGSSVPNFDQQKAQIELVLGYSLSDVLGLLSGEGAFALYPTASGTPSVLFVARVSDESKAGSIIDRLATLAAATGRLKIRSVQIGSVQAHEITLQNGTLAYLAVFDGKLVSTTSRAAIEQMQSGPHLADDPAYKTAVSGSGVPVDTSGFVYANLGDILPFAFDYLESHGRTVRQIVKDNTAPLRGLLLYGSKTGGSLTLTGFLGIQIGTLPRR